MKIAFVSAEILWSILKCQCKAGSSRLTVRKCFTNIHSYSIAQCLRKYRRSLVLKSDFTFLKTICESGSVRKSNCWVQVGISAHDSFPSKTTPRQGPLVGLVRFLKTEAIKTRFFFLPRLCLATDNQKNKQLENATIDAKNKNRKIDQSSSLTFWKMSPKWKLTRQKGKSFPS